MDNGQLDALTRRVAAAGGSRRGALAALAGGGLLAAFGREHAPAAAQNANATCTMTVAVTLRLGPSAGKLLGPGASKPGILQGDLSVEFGKDGAIDKGSLKLADGSTVKVVGQTTGRSLNLRLETGQNQAIVLVGVGAEEIAGCSGAVDGLATGPQPGDLGDWHATAKGGTAADKGSAAKADKAKQAAGSAAAGAGAAAAGAGGKNKNKDKTGGGGGGGGGGGSTGSEQPTSDESAACASGQTRCHGTCVDTATDAAHCGACGAACGTGELCVGGACAPAGGACASGQTACDDACVDLQSDPAHCGACGNACGDGTVCTAGACAAPSTCAEGQTACGEACVDLSSDPANCGACGAGCNQDETCSAGACAAAQSGTCAEGQTPCGDVCADLSGDPANCGACGNACGASQGCCGGTCTSLATVQNCGACGATCPGLGKPNANVTCQNGGTCTFSCQGDAYDVDGDPGNGCEQVLTGAGNHTSGTAKFASPATQDCFDSSSGGFSGTIASDARAHANPNVPGFDAATGSAPQFWKVTATGGSICQNGLDVLITMTGATSNCYGLTVTTDQGSHAAVVVNGAARINPGDTGIYSDDSTILFKVEKTCGTSVREVADYTVSYHL